MLKSRVGVSTNEQVSAYIVALLGILPRCADEEPRDSVTQLQRCVLNESDLVRPVFAYYRLSMFRMGMPFFSTLAIRPLKAIIQRDREAHGGRTDGMRVKWECTHLLAIRKHCRLVIVFILLVSFGGTGLAFFNKLTLMTNLSITIPWVFTAPFSRFSHSESLRIRQTVLIFKRVVEATVTATPYCYLWYLGANFITA